MEMRPLKKTRKTRIFISGPVSKPMEERGFLYVNSRFLAVQRRAYDDHPDAIIYNPMRFCRQDWSWLRCMIVCLWRVLRSDIVYVMYDYGGSRGSSMERKLALKLGKEVVYVAC